MLFYNDVFSKLMRKVGHKKVIEPVISLNGFILARKGVLLDNLIIQTTYLFIHSITQLVIQ